MIQRKLYQGEQDKLSKEMGASFYNKGVNDARAVVASRLQVIDEELYAIEKVL